MSIKSWWALLVREYLEHRIAFVYFPLGILGLIVLSAISGLSLNHVRLFSQFPMGNTLKVFEIGYLLLAALWLVYLSVALFFYFGDAFSADRRNNAMFFWKSMPVSDLKVLASKFLAAVTVFPLMIFVVAAVSGVILYLGLNIAGLVIPGFVPPAPFTALAAYGQVTLFAFVFLVLSLLWYAPFMAWVGALSTVFGRWSLPLAFVIPGLLALMENMVAFGRIPQGGYIWGYLSQRLHFGLNDFDLGMLVMNPTPFSATDFIQRLTSHIDWMSMVTGLVFAFVAIWLASEYRRRRIS